MDNEWFRRELYQYTQSKDRPTIGYGWGMGTLAARMGLTKRLMVSASPSYPEFRRILVNRFRKLAEVGADGIHIDKMVMAGGLEFGTPLSPDQSSWGGTYFCLQEIAKACREINPDFCIGTEVQWDGVLPFGGVTWWDGPEVWKRTFPEWTAVQGVNMAFGYIPVNNGVRLGRQLLIGPNHWTRSMGSEGWRSLSAYIGEINRIREALKETIYLGEYLGDEQIQLEKPANPHFAYSVFRNTRTGRRACILVNNGSLPSRCKVRAFDGSKSGEVEVHQPFAPTRRTTLPVEVMIPNESIVVVVED